MKKEQRARKKRLTLRRLKQALHYNPETGVFTWLIQCAHRNKPGTTAGTRDSKTGYITIGIDNGTYLAHRLAWFYMKSVWPRRQIDHRDLCRPNNVWTNLRPASHGQNVQNSGARKRNASGLKGAYFSKEKKKWHSRIMCLGKLYLLGYFETSQEAHSAYAAAAAKLHGQFARVA